MPDDIEKRDIKLIAVDLDGTLLTTEKELTARNLELLGRAAAAGIEIVPTTGRLVKVLSPAVSSLLFLHYAIGANGAQVFDMQKNEPIARAEIPNAEALEIMTMLDGLPLIYDCYMLDGGWMTRSMWERRDEFAPDRHIAEMIRTVRTPVDDLKTTVRERGCGVQKIQLFTNDPELRQRLMQELKTRFADLSVTSALKNNVEMNSRLANKGTALETLAAHIGIDMPQTMAFGDGSNDIPMLKCAGIGVAMGNASPDVKAAADFVTTDCDNSGVAAGIERFCDI